MSLRTILLANNIQDPDAVKAGTKLKVLPVSGIEHIVDKGESLADIAASYRVDLGPIIDFNGLSTPDSLAIGDKLVIPGATRRVIQASAPPAPLARQSVSASGPAAVVASAGSSAPSLAGGAGGSPANSWRGRRGRR